MSVAATAADRKMLVLELVAAGMTPAAAARRVGVARTTAYDWCAPRGQRPRAGTVPARPLVNWLTRAIACRWETTTNAAIALRCDEAMVRRVLRHPERRVTFDLVDRWMVAAGDVHMVSILYPLDDEQEAA